jgi:DNA-directed RNA polymerase subunit beta'
MEANIPRTNTIYRMVSSGARGNWMQLRQIAGMRGLVSNPKGDIIPRPIRANFREGLSVLEFFISTHGSRKGLADTALRTADSGYLTRRLVDVSQDVIIREDDCGTERGLPMPIAAVDERTGARTVHDDVETSVYARTLAEDVVKDGETLATAGIDLGDVVIGALFAAGVDSVKIRSVLTCDSKVGTCALCYGRSLATGKLVDIGEAVGIIAAQSIGEPGTQLTMRTFHTGGVAGDDITQGLPRVVELFEARTPKGVAPIAEASGRITIEETDKTRRLLLTPDDGSEEHAYPVTKRARLLVQDGQHVEVGTRLTAGNIDPKNVLRILGPRQTQMHLVDEVQSVYRQQGVSIHDKHIEVIVRQMLRRITIIESGDADLLPGMLAERGRFEDENRRVLAEGGKPASGRPELMGITKASLATESWLSAASFQETTRVLTEAAMEGKSDSLLGLKENVILGKLIPAGTGLPRYRDIAVEPTEEAKAAMYSMPSYDDYSYTAFGPGSGEAVRLDDSELGLDRI